MFSGLNRKTIIQILVITVAFAGSGVVLYNGFAKPKFRTALTAVSVIPTGGVNTGSRLTGLDVNNLDKTLPYSTGQAFSKALNDILGAQALNYGTIQYPKLDPTFDVGVNPQDLLKAPPGAQ